MSTRPYRRLRVARLVADLERESVGKLYLLKRYLTDADSRVRATAVAALGSLDVGAAMPALRDALSDPAPQVLAAAAQVIVTWTERQEALEDGLGKLLLRPLKTSATASDPSAACAMMQALTQLKETGAVGLLRELARRSPRAVRTCAINALGALLGVAQHVVPVGVGHRDPPLPTKTELRAQRYAVLLTAKGKVVIELHRHTTPLTVAHVGRLRGPRPMARRPSTTCIRLSWLPWPRSKEQRAMARRRRSLAN